MHIVDCRANYVLLLWSDWWGLLFTVTDGQLKILVEIVENNVL